METQDKKQTQIVSTEVLEKVEAKAKELTAREGVEVRAICFRDRQGNDIIGYLKYPNRSTKLYALDLAMTKGVMVAAEMLLPICLMKEESDQRILSEATEHDEVFLGACMACVDLVSMLKDQVKKN